MASDEMLTLLDMRTALQNDLTVDDLSDLFDPATCDSALNRAYRKIGGLFRWPKLQDSLSTSALANHQYYEYPDNWRENSIWKLTVDAVDYGEPMNFKDFLHEIEQSNPSGIINKWANYETRYFIDPTPTINGTNNIVVYGQKSVDTLDEDGDTTIFSSSMSEVNEAIVLEAQAILRAKGEEQQISAQFLSPQAAAIATNAWKRIQADTTKAEKTTPFFDVPDFFGRLNIQSIKKKIGSF